MSDLIDREDVIRIVQDRLNSPYMQNKWQQGACLSILRAIEELPSADAVSLEEFEQMRFLADKSMEMVGEPTWTSVLAELHDRFDALEKELRKASAEMSAIIREYVDRPKGEWVWNENGMDWGIGCWCCSECGMRNPYIGSGDTALLSNPHNWAGSKYCPNCGADMREREGE